MALCTLFTGFNQYKPEYGYRDLVFSLKFFMIVMGDVKYITLDIGKLSKSYPQHAMLTAFMLQTGRREGDAFYLPHSSLDFVMEILRSAGHVYYLEPLNQLSFSDDIKAPSIKVTRNSENEALIEIEPGFEIIQGRNNSYALYENIFYRLPGDFPISFYRLINGKNTVLDYKNIPESVYQGYTPGITPVKATSEPMVEHKIKQLHEKPQLQAFVGYDKQSGSFYIKPVIRYGSHLEIVAGGEYKPGNHYIISMDDGKFHIERNEIQEILLRNYFKKYSYYLSFQEDRYIGSRDDSFKILKEKIIPGLDKNCKVIYMDGLENLAVHKEKIKIFSNARFNKDNGLFELDLEFHCGNLRLTLDDLLVIAKKNTKYLHQGNDYIELENRNEIMKVLSSAKESSQKSSLKGRETLSLSLSPAKAIGFEHFLSECQNVVKTMDTGYSDFIKGATEKKLVQEASISPAILAILRQYQKSGVHWMTFLAKYSLGGILADDMGLGKTLQVLVLLQSAIHSGTSLVICPKTLVYNWYDEIMKFTPELKVLIPEGTAAQRKDQICHMNHYDLVITSYPLIRNDLENYTGFCFKYCILDEAQYIKNPDSETAKSVKSIVAETRLALTGTPMENSILELWSVFDFLMPDFLPNRKVFNEQFSNKPEALKERIKPFILRRTKTEMLPELPPKTEQIITTAMDREQLGLYMAVLESVRKSVLDITDKKSFDKSRMHVLAGLMRLRQICNHPGLVNEEYMNRKDISAKLELFEELVNESMEGGHKILVFSQFTAMLKILSDRLDEVSIPYSYLDGSTQNRREIISNFTNDTKIRVFLVSLKAGGYGLNLTAADTVILFDPWWNPMAEQQAIDRVYRMGQDKPVNVYKLITKGTIEEKILALQQKKRMLFDAVVSENHDFIESLGWEDILQVLV